MTGNVSFPNGSLGGDSEQSQSGPSLSSWTQVIYLFHSLSHSRDYICLLTPPCPRAPGGQVCFHCFLHLSSFTVPGIHQGGRIEEKFLSRNHKYHASNKISILWSSNMTQGQWVRMLSWDHPKIPAGLPS